MIGKTRFAAAAAGILLASCGQVSALEALGAHRDWKVYADGEGVDRTCWGFTDETNLGLPEPSVFFVSFSPEGIFPVYEAKDDLAGLDLTLRVKGVNFKLLTEGKFASFAPDDEVKALELMKDATSLRVRYEIEGRQVADRFSMMGVTAAIARVEQACAGTLTSEVE